MIRAEQAGSVLIVDASGDTSEVLRAVLEPRGVKVFSANEPREGLALLRAHHPNVTVLDIEDQPVDDEAVCDAYGRETGPSLVVLGSLPANFAKLPRDRVVSKPYHYAPLIRTIEALVEEAYARAG